MVGVCGSVWQECVVVGVVCPVIVLGPDGTFHDDDENEICSSRLPVLCTSY